MNQTAARVARFHFPRQDARALWLARLRRRARTLALLAFNILAWRNGARALAPAAWAFVFSALWLAPQAGQMGWFALLSLVLFSCLCAAALIDARYFVLPDGPLATLAATGAAMRLMSSLEDALS